MRLRFTELLKLLKANDVQITLSGDGMAYDAPQGVITADIAAEMKRHKADLISYLKLKSSLDEARYETNSSWEPLKSFCRACRITRLIVS